VGNEISPALAGLESIQARCIDINAVALKLRFVGGKDRLPSGFTGQHLQALRRLTPESSDLLVRHWDTPVQRVLPPGLTEGQVYEHEELGRIFDFRQGYLKRAGGMISRPDQNALLLITHSEGGKTFDYQDYWDGNNLVYTGQGQSGDQKLDRHNRQVAENSQSLLVFEGVGP